DIHPAAHIGGGFFIDHGTGVVIGETAIIGDNVRLYQHVTLGAKKLDGVEKGIPRHPIVEDDVVIYSGATVLGRITIGKGAVIGGGCWVTQDLPPGSFVTQARTQVEVFTDGAGI
nr:serine acetyltransferase [Actinomycetota bacterium]